MPWIVQTLADGTITASLDAAYSPGGNYSWNTYLTSYNWKYNQSGNAIDTKYIPELDASSSVGAISLVIGALALAGGAATKELDISTRFA